MKVKRQSVFISGPYRSKWGLPGVIWNIYKAWRVGRKLVRQGYSVFIPHLNTALMDDLQPAEFFLECCKKELPNFEIIYMMRGWESSIGATAELTQAYERKMTLWGDEFTQPVSFPVFEKLYRQWIINQAVDDAIKYEPLPFTDIEDSTKTVNCKLDDEIVDGRHIDDYPECPDKLEPQEVKTE